MRLAPVVAALLIASLAACGSEGADETPASETATEVAAMPEQTAETPAARATPSSATAQARDGACGADQLARWLNALPTEEVKAAIAAAVGQRPIRYYTRGDPITMDFSEARLNVELGEDGRIKLFRCG